MEKEIIHDTLLRYLRKQQLANLEVIYPLGTRFFYWDRHEITGIVVVEHKPQMRTITFTQQFVNYEIQRTRKEPWEQVKKLSFHLAFPYIIFVLFWEHSYFQELRVFYTTEPLTSLDGKLFLTNLPNIERNGVMCMGSRLYPRIESAGKIRAQTEKIIADFWQSIFTADPAISVSYLPMSQQEERLKNIWAWEKTSKRNPLFMLKVKWLPAGITLRELISPWFKRTALNQARALQRCVTRAIEERKE